MKLIWRPLAALIGAILCTPAVYGQQAADLLSKAPPDVDQALRARVKEFFDLQMLGKFRAAENVVCEASRDTYYSSDKKRWLNAEIQRINYEDQFKTAKVTMGLTTEMKSRAGTAPMTIPMTHTWKVMEGAWCFFIPAPGTEAIATPFGVFRPSEGGKAPPNLITKPIDPSVVANAVKASPREVRISAKTGGTVPVEISNTLPGSVQLRVEGQRIEGLTGTLKKDALNASETTVLEVTYTAGDKVPPAQAMLLIRVEPTGQNVLIKVQLEP